MIKCNEGIVELKGTADVLLAEFSVIVSAMKDSFSKDLDKHKIEARLRVAFEDGLMEEAELKKAIRDRMRDMLKTMMGELMS